MKSKEFLKTVILEFHREPWPVYTERTIAIPLHTQKIITVIGPRRSGKTVQLFSLMQALLNEGVPKHNILHINFEDERFDYTVHDFDHIIHAYLELYPQLDLNSCYLFFDEIQNIEHWDKYVRRLYDTVSKNIFISGSNAKLLSKEIATSLRGRTLTYQILPLSFAEFCHFRKIEIALFDKKSKALVINALDEYLKFGGFPEVAKFQNEIKIKTLQEYFNTMIYRDMVERYDIKNTEALKLFLKRIFSCATKSFSVNKIHNELKSAGIKTSKQFLYEYLAMAEEIYLIFILKKYSPSRINQELSEKKVYLIDNGILNAVTYKFSENFGKMMEQVVFQELIRREKTVFFFKEKHECDFLIQEGLEITQAIQVCYALDQPETLEREIQGLAEACAACQLKQGIIIARDGSDDIHHDGLTIKIIALHEWLLMPEKKQEY